MRSEILERLKEIEATHEACVLYACESGSRAWGFESRDSDYDVRFIYCHTPDWYLSVQDRRDVIEVMDGDLDLSGWDLRKALRLFRKCNPPLFEWLRSPIVYFEDAEFMSRLLALQPSFYSPHRCFRHYLHMAEGNFRTYLQGDSVRAKKYLYVLRPILACRWLEADLGPVPMEFATVLRTVDDAELLVTISDLVRRKREGQEMDDSPRIEPISAFIESELPRLAALQFEGDDVKTGYEELDRLLRATIG